MRSGDSRTAAHTSPAAGDAGRRTLGGRAASSLGPTGPTFRSTAPKVRRFSEYSPDQPNVSPKSQKFRNVHAMLHNPTKTPVNRSLTSRTRKMKPFRKSRYHGTRFSLNVSFVVSFFSFFHRRTRASAQAPIQQYRTERQRHSHNLNTSTGEICPESLPLSFSVVRAGEC